MSDDDRIDMLRTLALRKNAPLHWYGLAMALRGAGRSDEALLAFRRVHEVDADYVPAWFMRAQLHEERGEEEAARAALEEGIARAEEAGDAHAAAEMRSMLDTLADAP